MQGSLFESAVAKVIRLADAYQAFAAYVRFPPIADTNVIGDQEAMEARITPLANAASWVLFVTALVLAAGLSFVLLEAEAIWGMGQVRAAGPVFVAVVVYLITMPPIFGAIGLVRSSAIKRFAAAAAMLASFSIYTLVAFTR